jgi:hypothetical protein
MNILTEHDFQDAVISRQKRWERRMRAEGDYFEGDGGQWTQSYFYFMGAPVSEIMDERDKIKSNAIRVTGRGGL